jgi:hypothetical protein
MTHAIFLLATCGSQNLMWQYISWVRAPSTIYLCSLALMPLSPCPSPSLAQCQAQSLCPIVSHSQQGWYCPLEADFEIGGGLDGQDNPGGAPELPVDGSWPGSVMGQNSRSQMESFSCPTCICVVGRFAFQWLETSSTSEKWISYCIFQECSYCENQGKPVFCLFISEIASEALRPQHDTQVGRSVSEDSPTIIFCFLMEWVQVN